MVPPAIPERYKHHRFPAENLRHGVWLYDWLCLSDRDVEKRLCARGVLVSYKGIRTWCRPVGEASAKTLRRRPRPGDNGHWDEFVLLIARERHARWQAGDQDGQGLDMLVYSRRNLQAAKTFFCQLLTGVTSVPQIIIMDTLHSDGAANRGMRLRRDS